MLDTLLGLLLGLCGGSVAGYFLRRFVARKRAKDAEGRAEEIILEAKEKKEELLREAREGALKVAEDARAEQDRRTREIQEKEHRVEQREALFDKKLLEIEEKRSLLEQKEQEVLAVREDAERLRALQDAKLQEIAGLSREQAETRLLNEVEEHAKDALASRVRKMEDWSEEELARKARNLLSLAITRFASTHVAETTTSSVDLPAEDMKGRIIGKEGRNIKAIEAQTGVELIVDDTPGQITISGFSPIRRQVAKRALEALIKDGRIQPARIEEAVAQAKEELAEDIRKAGEDALYELGISVSSMDPKLVSILGRMKYRTSYGQNALQHSMEVAQLAAMMAEELGADVAVCKKGGLLHDIGKAVDHDMQGAHPEIGYNMLKKFGFPEEICYQSIAHHEDRPRTVEGAIVKAADAISGARPGARKQSLEQFLRRMEELEQTAASFEGVEKAYAIQAGREVRVFVRPHAINDAAAHRLAAAIAKRIESELRYPGEIRVTVIRETRSVEYAR